MALLCSRSQEYCYGCRKRLSACLIRSHTHYHPYCRSSSSSSSQPASAPVSAFVATPVTPAIIPSLISSASASTAPPRSHHSSKVTRLCPQLPRTFVTSTRPVLTFHFALHFDLLLLCSACCVGVLHFL
jgi:hypothetical protein